MSFRNRVYCMPQTLKPRKVKVRSVFEELSVKSNNIGSSSSGASGEHGGGQKFEWANEA